MAKIAAFDSWVIAERRVQWPVVSEGELVELGKSDTTGFLPMYSQRRGYDISQQKAECTLWKSQLP